MVTLPKKPIKGLLLRPKITRDEDGKIRSITFRVEIGFFKKGMNRTQTQFVTNPQLQQLLEKYRLAEGYESGEISYVVEPHHKLIDSTFVYPFTYLPDQLMDEIKRKGIGSFLEYRAEKLLEHYLPDYTIVSSRNKEPRRIQMERRQRDPKKPIPIAKARKLTRDYVANGMRRYNTIRRAR